MGTLLTILGVLFVALFVLVKVTEKHGKPMEPEQQQKLWRWVMILVFAGLIIRLLEYMISG